MPKFLFICRHAEAADPASDLPDFERNLTSAGIAQAGKAGSWLKAHFPVQAIVASPARRTRQTAQILAEMVKITPGQLSFNDQLYNAPVARILQVIAKLPDDLENVVLVGHNPGISNVIEELASAGAGNLEPANLAVVTFQAGTWSETEYEPGNLLEVFRPGK